MTATLSAETRVELLAAAEPEEVTALAERLLAGEDSPGAVTVVKPPKTGMVVMQVREPVAAERFYLGEVLAVECTVEYRGCFGWSMRLGDDRVAALAAAVLDAAANAGHPHSGEIEALCRAVAARREVEHAAEWDEIAPTIVEFEELP